MMLTKRRVRPAPHRSMRPGRPKRQVSIFFSLQRGLEKFSVTDQFYSQPVKMTVSKVSEAYYEPEIEATFVGGFVPGFTWAIQEAYAVDRHGNFLRPTGMCREEKSFRVVGRAQNVQTKSVDTPFEFSVRREKK